MDGKEYSLVEHLEELRSRIIKCAIFVFVASCVTYSFAHKIYESLAKPVGKLIFIEPAEAFMMRFKIAFFGGLFLSSPFILYEVWKFVSSGLKADETKYVLIFAPLSFLLFVVGAAFGYFIILPIGMRFLLGFQTENLIPMITVSKYLSFAAVLVFSFGIVFELPLIIVFLTKIGLVSPRFLSKKRRHAILAIFIIAAILTPPDVVTQCMMAIPLLILYEISVVFSRLVYRKM